MRTKSKPKIAFPYYGGKTSKLGWLLPLLPDTQIFLEPFGGSGAVTFNKTRSPITIYNDIDSEVIQFFRVLRSHKEEFLDLLRNTPFSIEEFKLAQIRTEDSVENARRFYIRQRQSYLSLGLTWARYTGEVRTSQNTKIPLVVARWINGIEGLQDIVGLLRSVIIENRDAVDFIKRFDEERALIYCDPPYVAETRRDGKVYAYEMDESKHIELAKCLNLCKGKVAISGYESDLYNRYYDNWYKTKAEELFLAGRKTRRQEILWTNYDPEKIVGKDQTVLTEFTGE